MLTLLEKHGFVFDPLRLGFGRRAHVLGLALTLGLGCPRVGGGYNLYQSGSGRARDIDWVNPVGTAFADATEIRTLPFLALSAGVEYVFALRAFSPGGLEGPPANNVVRLTGA